MEVGGGESSQGEVEGNIGCGVGSKGRGRGGKGDEGEEVDVCAGKGVTGEEFDINNVLTDLASLMDSLLLMVDQVNKK